MLSSRQRYVSAQEAEVSAISIPPSQDLATSNATIYGIELAVASQITDLPSGSVNPPSTKKPSGEKAAAEDSSTSQTPARHRPHSDPGDKSHTTHKAPHPTIIPSFPSPENPPDHPQPPPHPQNPPSHRHPPSHHGVAPVVIAFAAIGGVIAVFLAYMGFRCCYSYKRVPPPDRINDVFRSSAASPTRFVPPPPPYIQAPSYEDATTPTPSPPRTPPPPYNLRPADGASSTICIPRTIGVVQEITSPKRVKLPPTMPQHDVHVVLRQRIQVVRVISPRQRIHL
ncbi:hypothetical protein BC629DRAFT_1595006 [Irpex lacteus]|nr:hypothetical protein BC629DRAFT_1595006 [Irpex lacteus]